MIGQVNLSAAGHLARNCDTWWPFNILRSGLEKINVKFSSVNTTDEEAVIKAQQENMNNSQLQAYVAYYLTHVGEPRWEEIWGDSWNKLAKIDEE